MSIGDRVKLHIHPGRRDALGLPESVGTISAIDLTGRKTSVLIRFDDVSVYLCPTADADIEVVGSAPARS